MESMCPSIMRVRPPPGPMTPMALPLASTSTVSKPAASMAAAASDTAGPSVPDTLEVRASATARSTSAASSTGNFSVITTSPSLVCCTRVPRA